MYTVKYDSSFVQVLEKRIAELTAKQTKLEQELAEHKHLRKSAEAAVIRHREEIMVGNLLYYQQPSEEMEDLFIALQDMSDG